MFFCIEILTGLLFIAINLAFTFNKFINDYISILCRAYENLVKTADETKADFAAFERNDLKLREVRTVIC